MEAEAIDWTKGAARSARRHVLRLLWEASQDPRLRRRGVETAFLAKDWKRGWPDVKHVLGSLWDARLIRVNFYRQAAQGPYGDTYVLQRHVEHSPLSIEKKEVFECIGWNESIGEPHFWMLAEHAARRISETGNVDCLDTDDGEAASDAGAQLKRARFQTDTGKLLVGNLPVDITLDESALLLAVHERGGVPISERIGSKGQQADSIARYLNRKRSGKVLRRRGGILQAAPHLRFTLGDISLRRGAPLDSEEHGERDSRVRQPQMTPLEEMIKQEEQDALTLDD